MISDQNRRQKSREVSSRYLSPPSPPLATPSPSHTLSPNRQKPKSSSSSTKNKHNGFIWGLWPSSITHSSKSQKENPSNTNITATATLADHLGSERRKNGGKISGNFPFLGKQKSCSEFRRSENNSNTKGSLKENHTPVYGGGSMRYTGKVIPGRSSISSSTSSSSTSKLSDYFDLNQVILPGRLSVDENTLRRRSSSYMRSDSYSDTSESSDLASPFTTGKNSPASYMAPTLSTFSKSGSEVRSKYINPSIPMHNSNSPKKSTIKNAMKRENSLSLRPEWETSPSRFGSPLAITPSFSTSKPPNSSRGKKNLLHMGLDLIKGKKGPKSRSSLGLDKGKESIQHVHQLRLLQNSWMQWRYANARADVVHENLAAQCENNLIYAMKSVEKLRQSVIQKRLQLQKEKLEMKLNLILHSQIKMLEAWGDIERRHIVNVSMMKDYLHAVVCMIPLIQGAKVDLESASMAFTHTSDLVVTIKSMLSSVSPMAQETIITLSELVEIVTLERSLVEECFEHLRVISTLEMQERNLRCSIIAMDSIKDQQKQKVTDPYGSSTTCKII